MRKSYFIKSVFILVLVAFFGAKTNAQVRIVEVDPATDRVKIHNYGGTMVNITNYWFCSKIVYGQLSGMTVLSGSLNLAPNADVEVTSSVDLVAAADLGLYSSSNFSSTSDMVDFTQWGGSFVFPNGRENVATAKGIWSAGTFISVPAPYEYIGNGGQNGFQFWDTLLGVEDFEIESNFNIYPNPSNSSLNIKLKNGFSNGQLEIFDMLGKQIVNQTINSEELATINITSLNSGLYLIKVSFERGSETKRFVKN